MKSHHHHHHLPNPLPPSPFPSPSPSPSRTPLLLLPALFSSSSLDLTTILFIAAFLLLSLLSLSFTLYLRLKSRRLHHLENFNSLWTVRLLLVLLSAAWAANEILRLPAVRREYVFSCKIHVILSLGLLEPSFLVTLLFLVNVSIKKKKKKGSCSCLMASLVCSLMTLLQVVSVYLSPDNDDEDQNMLCTYPFLSCVLFGGFAAVYAVVFLIACWRLMAIVINKGMRRRIGALAASVIVALSVQITCLILSCLLLPEDTVYGFLVLAMFIFVLWAMAIGDLILVITPITHALQLNPPPL